MHIRFVVPKKKLIVLVKNRLVTIDAIMPLLIEMKEVYNMKSDIIVFDQLAHIGINENIVIRDALEYVGKEVYITKGKSNKILRRIHAIAALFFIIYDAFRGAKILHFGVLDQWPLNILGYIFKKNIYHVQGNAYNFDKFQHNDRSINKYTLVGSNLVSFGSKYINGIQIYDYRCTKIFEFGPPKKRSSWLQYIYGKSDYYFSHCHNNIDVSKGIIVIIMSSLDSCTPLLRDPSDKTQVKLFLETLDVLLKFSSQTPIFIKPHVYTNMTLLNNLIDNQDGVHITYLHPSVLATKSRIFIANQFSNTLADAHSLGVDTIEYTNYPESILKGTQGRSVSHKFVSYFINNDVNCFKNIVANILNNDFFLPSIQGVVDDESGLLSHLAK